MLALPVFRFRLPKPSSLKVFRVLFFAFLGLKNMIETSKKLITKIVYPFAIIKPSYVQGEVTLKDINQKIHNLPPKSEKPKEDEELYPTSAFSGKPVVSKTMIRTGGKGSITIMRTKG